MKKKFAVMTAAILFCIVICTALYYFGGASAGIEIQGVFLTDIIYDLSEIKK